MKPSLRGYTIEEIAENLLIMKGFEIKERRKDVIRGNVPIAEIDILAEKEGELYAVEVKAGRISLTDIRQAYTNAVLINAKPLIIGRGYSDKASEEAAKALNIDVIILDDYLSFTSLEELEASIDQVIVKNLLELFSFNIKNITSTDLKTIEVLANSKTFSEAADKLSVDKRTLGNIIKDMKGRGILTFTRSFNTIRLQANIISKLAFFYMLLNKICENTLKEA